LNASKGQCFLQFLHSSRPGSTRFGASVGCWKRCFQGYEYKKVFQTTLHGLFTPILVNSPRKRYESSGVFLKN
jgi:hypothetical protein